jgi:hypothetical protein
MTANFHGLVRTGTSIKRDGVKLLIYIRLYISVANNDQKDKQQ